MSFRGAYGRPKCFHCGKRHRQGNPCPRLTRKLCAKCGKEATKRRLKCHRCARFICRDCAVFDFGVWWCVGKWPDTDRSPDDCYLAERKAKPPDICARCPAELPAVRRYDICDACLDNERPADLEGGIWSSLQGLKERE